MNKNIFVYLKYISTNKYLLSLFVVLFGGFLWVSFNGFDIANMEKGYDPFRYLDHAINGCFFQWKICSSPIVNLLGFLGNNSISIYINYLLLIFCLLSISISKKLMPYLAISIPVLLIYLPQTGKDSFTIIGALSLISLLLDLNLHGKNKSVFIRNIPTNILRILIIILSCYLRKDLIYIYLILIYTFISNLFLRKKTIFYNTCRFIVFLLIIYSSLDQSLLYGQEESWINNLGGASVESGFSNERFAILLGSNPVNYFARFLFYFVHPFAIILVYLHRILNLNPFPTGFTYLYFSLLFIQILLIIRSKIIVDFFTTSIPTIAIISSFVFPHLRYFLNFFPVILIIAQIKRDNSKLNKNSFL